MGKLSDRALLVNVTISQWSGRKLDKGASDTVDNLYGATKAGNFNKKLLGACQELAAVTRAAGALRTFVYERTLPWMSDGSRILPSDSYVDFTAKFNAMRDAFETAVRGFVEAYPKLKEDARGLLGKLYNDSEYPHPSLINRAFGCDITVMPVPAVGDFRVDIGEAAKREFEITMANVEHAAMRDVWRRLHEKVSHAAQRLSDPEAVFRDTLVENLTTLCGLLSELNISDDPALEAMRVSLEQAIANQTAEKLRDSVIDRSNTASKLREIEAKMGAFMGGSNVKATA